MEFPSRSSGLAAGGDAGVVLGAECAAVRNQLARPAASQVRGDAERPFSRRPGARAEGDPGARERTGRIGGASSSARGSRTLRGVSCWVPDRVPLRCTRGGNRRRGVRRVAGERIVRRVDSAPARVAPGQEPPRPRRQGFGYEVDPVRPERPAATDARKPHPGAGPEPVPGNRRVRVFGAARPVSALASDEAGQGELIAADRDAGRAPQHRVRRRAWPHRSCRARRPPRRR